MGEVSKNTSSTITLTLSRSYTLRSPAYIELFEGLLDNWRLKEGRLNIEVTNILSQWARRTLATNSPSCRWRVFKGEECGYVGSETWCDRSYTRCEELGNTANFGGFRWIPSIVDREVWWGSVPSV